MLWTQSAVKENEQGEKKGGGGDLYSLTDLWCCTTV